MVPWVLTAADIAGACSLVAGKEESIFRVEKFRPGMGAVFFLATSER